MGANAAASLATRPTYMLGDLKRATFGNEKPKKQPSEPNGAESSACRNDVGFAAEVLDMHV